jgi:uncharacterized membrane protein
MFEKERRNSKNKSSEELSKHEKFVISLKQLDSKYHLLISFIILFIFSIIIEHIKIGSGHEITEFHFPPPSYLIGSYFGTMTFFICISILLSFLIFIIKKLKKKKVSFIDLLFRCNYSVLFFYLLVKIYS